MTPEVTTKMHLCAKRRPTTTIITTEKKTYHALGLHLSGTTIFLSSNSLLNNCRLSSRFCWSFLTWFRKFVPGLLTKAGGWGPSHHTTTPKHIIPGCVLSTHLQKKTWNIKKARKYAYVCVAILFYMKKAFLLRPQRKIQHQHTVKNILKELLDN